ncbi:bidirectional sugar transporter SWEET2 isoform X3 [Morus notabilis]|uniref:bidirectional sugar transporter SWEET2 isoform X3 n=1 Tax=Morus notabilis TaxID=981085 RepID=UPI000CED657A|nr:bidirectional sugar transporter SWEET2 isoform X3 [Morus notabilis]
MILGGANSLFSICRDAAGVAGVGTSLLSGCLCHLCKFYPIPTFRRIVRNRSTEQFSGIPYIYALLNCLVTLWYGTPLISPDNVLIMTVNSVGALFQSVYIILFIVYSDKPTKVRALVLLLAVFSIFGVVVGGSLQIIDPLIRRNVVGLMSSVCLVSMFASPLFIINLVIQTKSVEYMPFYISLSTFLMSTSFFLYGILNYDAFIYVPNGIGTILGIVQLALYFYYKNSAAEDSKEPLIISYE